ncbi:MAG: tripartite tricarboxylate transporter TctB family protein [Desulfomonile tiedjei]|uniref:Tripartite tricarboxylate transporter TctB family protein n=1 Tax=Desulfomonile tiedjei TaxID=2358 RepID=A0A9D6V7Z6_9BACT|nr:tripartite tricarboxylate transporter TctB family protein [Desulfomonile tiedjei]
MNRTQSQYDRISGIAFLMVGVFFAVYARRVDIGTWNEPGPGFMPFWLGLTMCVMAVALLIGSFRRAGPVMPPFFPKADSWKRVLATFAALGVYALILKHVGFTLTTFLFVTFLVKFIFPQTWTRALVVAFLASVCARFLFVDFLKTQLPKGYLGF